MSAHTSHRHGGHHGHHKDNSIRNIMVFVAFMIGLVLAAWVIDAAEKPGIARAKQQTQREWWRENCHRYGACRGFSQRPGSSR